MKNPVLPAVAIVGVLVAMVAVQRAMFPVAIIAAVIAGLAIFLATKPAVSAVLATLGLLGGLTTFVVVPNSQNAAMTTPLRLLSMLLFTMFYTVLMDGVVLLVAVLYNLFAGAIGLGGLSLDLEDEGDAGGA
ncbi:MAG TPA: hypothetical protein DCZ01_09785 [Elusimicrobia bacterium]|nr:MAG: hypothetical protein A2X37_09345 [Elusimicrobia bacterium GWA2_66_18]HAZ08790.1 hypothetical protein [Elusimicrobiota bacterium]